MEGSGSYQQTFRLRHIYCFSLIELNPRRLYDHTKRLDAEDSVLYSPEVSVCRCIELGQDSVLYSPEISVCCCIELGHAKLVNNPALSGLPLGERRHFYYL